MKKLKAKSPTLILSQVITYKGIVSSLKDEDLIPLAACCIKEMFYQYSNTKVDIANNSILKSGYILVEISNKDIKSNSLIEMSYKIFSLYGEALRKLEVYDLNTQGQVKLVL